MADHIASIRAKLTDAELAFLKEAHGIELRDPEMVAALSEYDQARAQILAIEERALRNARERDGEPPHCSFCDGSSHAVGPLAASPRGPLICHDCAVACASIITAQQQGDA
jgi:hypothetical protein